MKFLSWAIVAVLATAVAAWTKEDHEIFDLVSELEKAEGKGTSFYSFLEVPSTATTQEISKAYRKKSMVMHPDKNPDIPGIHERFSRLGVITKILRTQEERERYDHFYKNGVPKWRGTGYYYSRFRPGLGSVFAFLIVVTSAVQYVALKITRTRALERMKDLAGQARASAWGPRMVPIAGRRKLKVSMGPSEGGEPAKTLDVVVEGEDVYILEPSGEKFMLDERGAPEVTVSGTWFIALLKAGFNRIKNGPTKGEVVVESETDQVSGEDTDASATASGTEASVEKKIRGPRKPQAPMETSKAGGTRRKMVRKKSTVSA